MRRMLRQLWHRLFRRRAKKELVFQKNTGVIMTTHPGLYVKLDESTRIHVGNLASAVFCGSPQLFVLEGPQGITTTLEIQHRHTHGHDVWVASDPAGNYWYIKPCQTKHIADRQDWRTHAIRFIHQ
jgi:hypothetical protein